MDKILELLKLFEKFGVKPGKIIGTGDRKITPIKKPILSKTLNRGYLDEDVQAGKISNQTVKNEIEDLAPLFFSKQLNDVEINNAINNLNYLDNLLNPTNIIDITTKQPVKGLESLKAPTSIAGELESAGKNLEKKAEELKGIVDEKPKSIIGDIMKDYGQFQKVMQDEKRKGLVRATARSILYDDIKSGKIKTMTLEDLGSLREPIDPFRKMYGEEALEQLDSLTDEFGQMRTAQEAAELAKSRFKLEPSDIKPEGSISIDEAKKGEQEFGINKPKETEVTNITSRIYKDADPDELIVEYNKNNQRLSLTDEEGGTLISYDEFNKLNKRNREIENILESLNVTPVLDDIKPEGIVIPFKKKITEPEEKAEGGIIRTKFAAGGKGKKILDIINKANKKLKGKKSMETVNPKTGEITVADEFVTTAEKKLSKPTKEEYDEYREILYDGENEFVQGDETFEQLDALVKEKEDYKNYMYMQYKRGKLDPVVGEKTKDRLNFLRKKAEDAELTGDRRLITSDEFDELEELEIMFRTATDSVDKPIPGAFSFNDPEIKAGMEKAMQEAKKRGDEMRKMGLDPASGRDYDKYIEIKTKSGDKDFNKYFDDLEIKTKFKNVISDDLLEQILIDDNPQRKAEVVAAIEQGLKMQEKGMSPQEIVDILKNAPRTKQAKGGSVGLNYLMGF